MADDNGNGRITMAVIGAKLDQVIATLDRACREQEEAHERIVILEQRLAAEVMRAQTEHGVFRRDIDGVAGSVEKLRARDMFGSVGASLLALAAGAVGWLKP